MHSSHRSNLFLLGALHLAASPLLSAAPVNFSREIRPILSENCYFCHGPDEKARKGKLRLDEEAGAKREHEGSIAVVPGKPELSALIERILSTDPEEVMPPPKQHKVIAPAQIALLKQWIQEGARWGKHWSYEPVIRPPVPPSSEKNPIDAFLEQRLTKEKLQFSPEVDRPTLIRRLALDLTGLPPSLEELKALAKVTPDQVITHFLTLPAFGEHWARQWLDLARYADSAGYPSDPGREIFSYRDWVIRSLNSNQPFDQFTVEQLAGDLLPNPTEPQLIATAFHRNTMTNNEGGTDDEEFRVAAIIDRVNTTFAVWMGTTMACAQCHTHKYDPISNAEYFQAFAVLNQTADSDKRDESPLLELIEPALKLQREAWTKEEKALEDQFSHPSEAWLEGFDSWLESKPSLAEEKLKAALRADPRTPAQLKSLQLHYARAVSPASAPERKQAEHLAKQLKQTKPVTVPILRELEPKNARKTQIQLRGNWQALGEEVQPGVPAAFPPLPPEAPHNRLGFARWLVSRENPLTARVTVNRMWESLFGVGIVRSSEEFGSQGDLPVHPELLDWLAAEFMESGWDVKHLLTLLVDSRAYRQISVSTPELNERDPDNRLLARGPRFRPSGELLRDQALAVSGLLSPKMFGPAVRPLRPSLGLSTAFGSGNDWTTSPGEDRHRRSLYTETRRNSPYPSFSTFDAPNREVCVVRRGRSNTPLQAFVTLNDPAFVETHQALARRILKEGGTDTSSRIRFAYEVCLSREPEARDLATLSGLYERARTYYQAEKEQATKLATDPIGPIPKEADPVELAAWTTVANVVMNLDDFLMRR